MYDFPVSELRCAVGFVQAFQFFSGDRYHGAVTGMEIHADGMVYHFEVFEVGTFRKLVFAFHIYIVHQNIFVRTYQREDACTFHSFFRLLFIIIRFRPLSGSQRGGSRFFDSIAIPFRLIKQMIKPVFVDNVAVDT